MRLSSFRALSAAAAAVALAAPAPALAQREIPGANGLWTMLQREMEKSTDMLQQLWGSAFGNHGQTTVVVLTVDEQEDDELTDEEKAFACRVAVERVDEQAALTREAQRMTSRLRTPLGKLVTFHFEGETSCDDLASPALVRECARVASMDTEIAAFLRRGKTHDEICDVVHMMDELANDPPPLSCKLCKRFVKMVDDAIKQDMAQVQQVREILGDICDSMSVDSMCHTFLKHYDDVVQWLVHGTDPQVVCERLTMCAPVEGDETALTVAVDRVSHACFYCEHISGAVAFVLQHAPGQLETLHTIVKFACKLAPKDCKCGDISTNYGKIVDWTKQGKTPEEICIALGMCKKEEAATMAVATVSDDKHGCFYCEHIAGAVQFVVQHAPDQLDALRKAIKVVCKLAPKDCKCEDMATNFDKIVDWVKQGKTPEDICVALGMCKKETSDNETRLAVLPTVSDDNHACFYCEHISGAVAFVIQHAPDQLSILRKAIKVVCKLAPKDCKCDDYSANFDKIVDWTKQGKTPEEICVSIGMCKKTESSTKMLGLVMNPKFAETLSSLLMLAGRDDKKCFYCEYFTTLLEIAIQEDEQSMDQIRQYADLICGILGDNKYCHEYVSKLDTAIDDIKKGEKPHEICADMLFCTKTEEAARLAVVTRSDDKQCFYCDYFVTLLEIVMQQDDADVEQIQQYADLVCGMLGDDNICHKYMDKFDAAIDALKQGKKPREICTEFKFCTKFQTLALPPPTIVDGDNECFYCDYFVTILEIVIQEDKADIDQVREFADMICGMLGDDNVCHQYVDKFDKAVDELRQGKKPREICVDLKFCANKAIAVKRPVVSEKKCLYCDYFVTILEVFIVQDDTDINMVRQYADMICGMLGDDNVCHQYVDKFDVIVDDLKSGKKPHDICVDVKFCTKSQVLALPVPVAPQDNKTCFYCDYITTILEVALQEDPNDVDGIRLYAEIVCGMLGDGSVCHKYLDQLNYAIDALKKGKKPREICAEFKYCGSSQLSHSAPVVINTAAVLKDAMVKHVVPRAVSGVDECFFCTQVASLMKVAVAQDPTKVAEIRTVADLICKTLPAENKCHAVMREMDQIIDSIKQGEEPAAICQDMKFCKKTEANFPVPKQVAAVKDNTCAYCDGIATVLEYALKSKPDQVQQLREAAGIVCDFMPQDDKCHDDLKQFDKAVESLKAGKSPHEVCVDANLCHDKAMPTTSSKLLPSSIAKLNLLDSKTLASKTAESEKSMSMGCLLCEYTAEALVIIKGDASELRLAKQALETMCIVLPPSARCDVLSSKFDELVELVGKGKSPSQACNAISLCDAAFVEPMRSPSEPKRIGAVVAEQ